MSRQFRFLNKPSEESEPSFDPLSGPFTLTAHNSTDIWRIPPSHDVFSGEILVTTVPLSDFKRLRVTVSAPWKTLYDQGGLIFILPSDRDGSEKPAWIKSGVELEAGQLYASVVAANPWSDWSLTPVNDGRITLEMERVKNALWVYRFEEKKVNPMRELTWVFEKVEGREVQVGVYTCKPKPAEGEGKEELEVQFEDLQIETFQRG